MEGSKLPVGMVMAFLREEPGRLTKKCIRIVYYVIAQRSKDGVRVWSEMSQSIVLYTPRGARDYLRMAGIGINDHVAHGMEVHTRNNRTPDQECAGVLLSTIPQSLPDEIIPAEYESFLDSLPVGPDPIPDPHDSL